MAAVFVVLVIAAGRYAGIGVGAHARALWPFAVAGAVSWAVTRAVADAAAGAAPPLVLAAAAAACLAVYALVLAALDPAILPGALRDARRSLGRPSPERVPGRKRSPVPALALAGALLVGGLAAVDPMLAVGAAGASALLALAFVMPVAHLVLLVIVTAIVPFDVQN